MMQEESMQSYGHTSYTHTHSVFVVNGSLCQRVTYVLPIKASGYIALMEVSNSEHIPQTFFIVCRITPSASARRQKTWLSSARAINEQVIRRTSPASGQRALGKWHPMKIAATTHRSSSEKLPIQSPKYGYPRLVHTCWNSA